MRRINVHLDDETAAKLAAAVERDKVSRSAWVRDAIKMHLHKRRRDAVIETMFDDKPSQR